MSAQPQSGEVDVRQMLDELARPAGLLREEHRELETHVVAAMNPLLELLCSARGRAKGESAFAVRQLTSRAMSDIIAAVHLITHGYVNQAYGEMRMAYEALDLVELLATDPEQAKLWVNTKKGHHDFRPADVRKRLGRAPYDEVYSQLSAFAHPRFEASRVNTFKKSRVGGEDVSIVIRVGPTMLDEIPDHWLAAGFLAPLIGMLSVRLSHLAIEGAVSEADWDTALAASHAGVAELGKLVASKLIAFGLDAEGFASEYERTPEMLAELNSEIASDEGGQAGDADSQTT